MRTPGAVAVLLPSRWSRHRSVPAPRGTGSQSTEARGETQQVGLERVAIPRHHSESARSRQQLDELGFVSEAALHFLPC